MFSSDPKSKRGNRIPTTVYFDPVMRDQLVSISNSTEVPMAALVRQAITMWLSKRTHGKRTTLKAS